jgi:DNA primase
MPSIDFPALRSAISLQSVLDLLGFVPSQRQGDQLRGPCPIHKSKSPQSRSFSANLARNVFQCFTCKAAGNQIDLWSLTHSLTLFDAATDLCNRLHIAVPQRESRALRSPQKTRPEKRNP